MSQDKNVGTSKTTEVACVEGGEDNVPTHGESSSKRERDRTSNQAQPKVYFKRQTGHYCGLAAPFLIHVGKNHQNLDSQYFLGTRCMLLK